MENKKVLIVEDETLLCNALCDKFAREGFTVFEAKNGEEGLKAAFKEHPDLILLDIIMPVMDGMEMLKKLREDEWGKNTKVIILTNLGDNKKLSDAMGFGAYEFLVKTDWRIEDIVKKVHDKLK